MLLRQFYLCDIIKITDNFNVHFSAFLACKMDLSFIIDRQQHPLKACFCYFSLFLKDKRISSLVRTKYIEKKLTLQLFFLLTVSRTFILSWATTRYLPFWNFLFRKNNYMCNQDSAHDVAACPDE